jgi:ABC-type amino acid transport substrate-binding protein
VRGGAAQKLLESIAQDCETGGSQRPQVSYFDDASAAQTQMRSGKIDAFAGISVPLRYVAKTVDNGKVFKVADMEFLGGAQSFALPKSRDDMASALQAALRVVIDNDRYSKILAEYGAEKEALTAAQIVLNPATSGELDDVVSNKAKA